MAVDAALHGDGLTSLQFRPRAGDDTGEMCATVSAVTINTATRQPRASGLPGLARWASLLELFCLAGAVIVLVRARPQLSAYLTAQP